MVQIQCRKNQKSPQNCKNQSQPKTYGISKISRESSVRETSQQVKVNAIVYNMSERLQNRMSE